MPNGLYGKLPCKRDFVALNAPRRFLEVWEPWLQGSVAMSRQILGEGWRDIFNRAPIWRFWLGANFCGAPVLGAFMPSIDGVGRAFPLTIFATDPQTPPAPPEIDPSDAWCDAAENVLLDALNPDAAYDDIAAAVVAIASPMSVGEASTMAGMRELPNGAVLARDFDDKLALVLRAARRFGHRRAFGGESFWWTIGGEGYASAALAETGLPSPERFADMLTGEFSRDPATQA